MEPFYFGESLLSHFFSIIPSTAITMPSPFSPQHIGALYVELDKFLNPIILNIAIVYFLPGQFLIRAD